MAPLSPVRWRWWTGAAAVLVLGGGVFGLSRLPLPTAEVTAERVFPPGSKALAIQEGRPVTPSKAQLKSTGSGLGASAPAISARAVASASAAAEVLGPRTVEVNVDPPTALIFRGSRKLGKPPVMVELQPGEKKRLLVIHDGYGPRRLQVDGTESNVNVVLIPNGANRKGTSSRKAAARRAASKKSPEVPESGKQVRSKKPERFVPVRP
ncbi:hypothetical protein ACFL5O_02015 [Myxococcota bacterium]